MLDLIRFELKKIVMRKSARYTCIVVFVLLCGIMALNVVQTKEQGPDDTVLSGFAAIELRQQNADRHAGELTDARVAEELALYYETAFSQIDPQEFATLSDQSAYETIISTYDAQTVDFLHDNYYGWLLSAWSPRQGASDAQVSALIGPAPSMSFHDARASRLQRTLDEGQRGTWEYSQVEREYWTAKQALVSEPLAYGYAGGWQNIIDCVAFVVFVIVGICVALAPVFAGEYQNRTDSVLLSARYGRSRLVAAKIIAAAVFATGYFALCMGVICAVSLFAHGVQGGGLPIQVMALSSPYNLTMAQAAGISVGLAYLMTMGFAAFTLLLSSKMKSLLAIFVIDVALAVLTGMIPTAGIGVLVHVVSLFPTSLSGHTLFWACQSYPLGGFVTDTIGMIAMLYAVVLVMSIPLAALSFRRHQVA